MTDPQRFEELDEKLLALEAQTDELLRILRMVEKWDKTAYPFFSDYLAHIMRNVKKTNLRKTYDPKNEQLFLQEEKESFLKGTCNV